jgi:hypothetical protein
VREVGIRAAAGVPIVVDGSVLGFAAATSPINGRQGQSGRTRSSWLRDSMPSLVKTMRRGYWTVRALMNMRTPISD